MEAGTSLKQIDLHNYTSERFSSQCLANLGSVRKEYMAVSLCILQFQTMCCFLGASLFLSKLFTTFSGHASCLPPGFLSGAKLHKHRFQLCHMFFRSLLQISAVYLQGKFSVVRWHSCLTDWKQHQNNRELFKLLLWLVRGKQYKSTSSIVFVPVFMLAMSSTNFISSVLCALNAPE